MAKYIVFLLLFGALFVMGMNFFSSDTKKCNITRMPELQYITKTECNISEANDRQCKKEINNEDYSGGKTGTAHLGASFSFRRLFSIKLLKTNSSFSYMAWTTGALNFLSLSIDRNSFSLYTFFPKYPGRYYINMLRHILI